VAVDQISKKCVEFGFALRGFDIILLKQHFLELGRRARLFEQPPHAGRDWIKGEAVAAPLIQGHEFIAKLCPEQFRCALKYWFSHFAVRFVDAKC